MDILIILIPVSLGLGGLGLLAFVWTLRARQYEDPLGDAARILSDAFDREPKPPEEAPGKPATASGGTIGGLDMPEERRHAAAGPL